MTVSKAEYRFDNKPGILGWLNAKQSVVVGITLFLLAALSRLPFVGTVLYHWDSINFAFSLERFDVAAGQPHVPGYILYVYLARLVNIIVNDAQLAMVGISIISSGLAVVFLYLLGKSLFNRATGLVAALFLASSPLFWFYGEIALPHSLDALAVVVAVWMLYEIIRGRADFAVPAALWLGIAGGLRPQTQVFLAPLALYAAWRLDWRRKLVALCVLAVVDLAWFVPLVELNGGLVRYFEIMGQFSNEYNSTSSVLSGAGTWGLARNLRKLGMYTLYGWSLALVPALLAGPKWLRSFLKRKLGLLKETRFWFLVLWVFPVLIYYVLIHMGQQGLVFVFLPALLLLSAAGIHYLDWARPLYRQLMVAVLILGNCVIFVAAPTYPLGGDRPKLLTAETLRRHDAYYLPRFESIRQHFAPQHTVLLSSGWRFPEYYLPDYSLAPYRIIARWELGEGLPRTQDEVWLDGFEMGLIPDDENTFYLVLFDDDLLVFNQSSEQGESLVLPNGNKLVYMRFSPQERLYLGPQSFGIVSATAEAK